MMASTVGDYLLHLNNGILASSEEEMKFEAARLKTFGHWLSYDRASPISLAKAGFFYTGNEDVVKCFACHIHKGGWNRNLDPILIHRELRPKCRFCQGIDETNVPIFVPGQREYEEILQNLHHKYCGTDAPVINSAMISHRPADNEDYRQNQTSQTQTNFPVVATDSGAPETNRQAIGSRGALGRGHDSEAAPTREEFASMKQESKRFSSFDSTWPRQEIPDPRDLARAGFYYTGTVDRVQCAFCRGILRNWDEDDVPMEEHRRHFPMCPFVMGLDVGNIPDPTAIISASTIGEVFSVIQPSAVVSDACLGIVTERPKHAQYAVEAARITSFRNWPSGKEQTPALLAKAGFSTSDHTATEITPYDVSDTSGNEWISYSDQHDVAPPPTGIRPSQHEPYDTSESDDSEGAEREREEDDGRLLNTEWCICGNCQLMGTVAESVCCQEIEEMSNKCHSSEVQCLTEHPSFDAVCLNTDVLDTAYYQYRHQYKVDDSMIRPDEKYRHVAYRQVVRWCWHRLGKHVRRPIPSCVVGRIRDTFPSLSGTYAGFKWHK